MNFQQFPAGDTIRLILFGAAGAVVAVTIAGAGYAWADSPQFCGSCHSMIEPAATWRQSNHKQFICTECHLPHDSLAEKLVTKMKTGNRDVYHETLRDYPAALILTQEGRYIIDRNCLRCHSSTVENTAMGQGGQDCIKCHRALIHGRNHSVGGMEQ